MASKKRQQKTSKGIHGGGGKTRLSLLQKALISRTFSERAGERTRRRIAQTAGKPKASR